MDLVEGKDDPCEHPLFVYSGKGETVSYWYEKKLHGTVNFFVLGYGFFVPHGMLGMKSGGAFSAVLMKKSRYCPRQIDGDKIKNFAGKPLGYLKHCMGVYKQYLFMYLH